MDDMQPWPGERPISRSDRDGVEVDDRLSTRRRSSANSTKGGPTTVLPILTIQECLSSEER